jgi:hypothetical protein
MFQKVNIYIAVIEALTLNCDKVTFFAAQVAYELVEKSCFRAFQPEGATRLRMDSPETGFSTV